MIYDIYKENYKTSDTIFIENFYARNVFIEQFHSKHQENSSVNFISGRDTLLMDSLFTFLKNELNKINLNLVFSENSKNLISDSLWIGRYGHNYNNVNKIDTCFIKNKIRNKNKITLVPVIHYRESYTNNHVDRVYNLKVTLSFFIIEKNRIIYASNKVKTKRVSYVDIEEFHIKQINVKPLWKELVYESFQPYIERSN